MIYLHKLEQKNGMQFINLNHYVRILKVKLTSF
jgi:hypothetical protein